MASSFYHGRTKHDDRTPTKEIRSPWACCSAFSGSAARSMGAKWARKGPSMTTSPSSDPGPACIGEMRPKMTSASACASVRAWDEA
eukprot:1161904-Pelagomonas_calceolata.AAC.5